MKEEIRKRFFDEDSIKMAIELVSKPDINNVEVSHLYALLNGVPASKIDKTRGAGGKVYYGLVYRDFNAKKGSRHSINKVFFAFNKRYGTNISAWEIRELDKERGKCFSCYDIPLNINTMSSDELRNAYRELLRRHRMLRREFLSLSSLFKRTQAELNVVTAEKEVLEENKEKMKDFFLKRK